MKTYRHKKSGLIVKKDRISGFYKHESTQVLIPPVVVEASVDWEEEIVVLGKDFNGETIDNSEVYYITVLNTSNFVSVYNGLTPLKTGEKGLEIFNSYEDATKYQRIVNFLQKIEGLVTTTGAPTIYLKKVLKSFLKIKSK